MILLKILSSTFEKNLKQILIILLSQIANKFIESNIELFEYKNDEFEIIWIVIYTLFLKISEIVQNEFERFY